MVSLITVSVILELPFVLRRRGSIKFLTIVVVKNIWPSFLPTRLPREASPLSMDWFSLARTSSAVFHASIAFAAAHLDSVISPRMFEHDSVILAHKAEAIRHINLELRQDDLPDSVIMAIMCMVTPPEDSERERQESMELDRNSPFKPAPMPPAWHENFSKEIRVEDAHFAGVRTVVKLKGGISGIKSLCAAKVFAQ
jgi:hypothetical protein